MFLILKRKKEKEARERAVERRKKAREHVSERKRQESRIGGARKIVKYLSCIAKRQER